MSVTNVVMGDNAKRQLIERTIVRAMLKHMAAKGWLALRTWDGEGWGRINSDDDVLALCFNLDEVSLRFAPSAAVLDLRDARAKKEPEAVLRKCRDLAASMEHGVLLIFGNGNMGRDVISDWNYSDGDADGFNAALEPYAFEEVEKVADGIEQRGTNSALHADQMAVLWGVWQHAHSKIPPNFGPAQGLAPVFFIGDSVRYIGECSHLADAAMIVHAANLSAEKLSEAVIDDHPRGYKRRVFIAHA